MDDLQHIRPLKRQFAYTVTNETKPEAEPPGMETSPPSPPLTKARQGQP